MILILSFSGWHVNFPEAKGFTDPTLHIPHACKVVEREVVAETPVYAVVEGTWPGLVALRYQVLLAIDV